MATCMICLGQTRGEEQAHPACAERLFGTTALPVLEFELGELYAIASRQAGKLSISGAQEKVSLRLSGDGLRLEPAETGGQYILKPEPSRFSALPQNEHLTMRLASLVEIETPPFGLVRLKDGAIAYVVKRFDRLAGGGKLPVEDFCQLGEIQPKDKYELGSAELCVRLLRKYASEPLIEIRKLFRLLLFGWWTANGDMHMKNFSLITGEDGTRRLSPAYDLVNTRLVLPDDDSLAVMMCGRKKKITRRKWLDFAEYCRIPRRAAERLVEEQIGAADEAVRLVGASFLPEKQKLAYERILREDTEILRGGSYPTGEAGTPDQETKDNSA